MSSLKGMNPTLRRYLRRHHVPDIFETLMSGLAIVQPEDPYIFIEEKIRELMNLAGDPDKFHEICKWDLFIPEECRPHAKVIPLGYLDSIFGFEDEDLQPTPEMYAKAYQFYNNKITTLCFGAWKVYHEKKRRKREDLARKMAEAAYYHELRIKRIRMEVWVEWHRYRKGRQIQAYTIIERVANMSVSRLIFEAWHNVMLDAKRTREYFENKIRRLERGEVEGEEEILGPRGEARDDISLLPRRVAIKIFTYVDMADLGRCAMVCRSWRMITQANSLWYRIDLSRVGHKIRDGVTDKTVIKLLQKCRAFLIHLNLRSCFQLTRSSFIAISMCKNLQDLNLSECIGLNDDLMREITERCKILLYLNLSHTNITDGTLRLLSRNCTNLQFLSLAYCKRFGDSGLAYLANGRGCRKLTYIDLSGCLQVTVEGYASIAEGCTNLLDVVLNDLPTLQDACISCLAAKCLNIRSLSFMGTPLITDVSLKAVAFNKKLEKVRIESNARISDASIRILGKNCHHIQHIYLADCPRLTDNSLKALMSCKYIRVLNLADCVRISDQGVRQMVEGPSGTKLQEINLTNCVRVSDVSVVRIMQKCHSLRYASFCFCDLISDTGLELLSLMPHLTSIDISGCSVTDSGLGALGNNKDLVDVNLSECIHVTDLGIQKFTQKCRELERLDLSHIPTLKDSGIKHLAFCCRKLTFLNLAGCKLLTDKSIQYLSGVCRYLITLDISGCLNVTEKSLKYLRKGCKCLKTLIMLYCMGVTKEAYDKMVEPLDKVIWSDDMAPFSYYRQPPEVLENADEEGSVLSDVQDAGVKKVTSKTPRKPKSARSLRSGKERRASTADNGREEGESKEKGDGVKRAEDNLMSGQDGDSIGERPLLSSQQSSEVVRSTSMTGHASRLESRDKMATPEPNHSPRGESPSVRFQQ